MALSDKEATYPPLSGGQQRVCQGFSIKSKGALFDDTSALDPEQQEKF